LEDFAHLSVLISIVLGLGLTNLLMGLARIVQMRARIQLYWPTLVWVFTLLLVHVQTWWSMFGLRTVAHWTFASFAATLMQPILLYFLSALALPDFDRDDALDLRKNYAAQRMWFFGILVALVFVSLLRNVLVTGHLQGEADFFFHLGFILGAAGGLIFTGEPYHKSIAVIAAAMYTAYVGLLFATLR